MRVFLVLAVGLSLAQGQEGQCGNTSSCLYPPCGVCNKVTLDPTGFGPEGSPYFRTMLSNVTGAEYFDNYCITYFDLGDGVYLVVESSVNTDGTYSYTTSLRGDITGSLGAYRYEGKDTSLGCSSCVANDLTLKALHGECEGVYLVYRCPIYGECVEAYAGQDIVYVIASALVTSPVPPCCQSAAAGAAQRQGLSPPQPLPQKLRHRCVTRFNGMTAVNAKCVDEEDSVEINGCT